MEAYCLGPDLDHAPYVERDGVYGDCTEHGFSAEIPPALDTHEDVDADSLRYQVDNEQLAQPDHVVVLDFVLQRADNGDSGVEGVMEEEEACKVRGWQPRSRLLYERNAYRSSMRDFA